MQSIRVYRNKEGKKIVGLDEKNEKVKMGFPYLMIDVETDGKDIKGIKGRYILTQDNIIRCKIDESQMKSISEKIRGKNNDETREKPIVKSKSETRGKDIEYSLDAKLEYNLKSRCPTSKFLSGFLSDVKRAFCGDLACYLVYLKLMKDPKIWETTTFPFPFKLPMSALDSSCLNYKVYVHLKCMAKITVIAGDDLPGKHWLDDISHFWDDWSECFSDDPQDRILLEAECETLVCMAQTLEKSVEKKIHDGIQEGISSIISYSQIDTSDISSYHGDDISSISSIGGFGKNINLERKNDQVDWEKKYNDLLKRVEVLESAMDNSKYLFGRKIRD